MTSMKRWARRLSTRRDGPPDPAPQRARPHPGLPADPRAALRALLPADGREDDRVDAVWERLLLCAHPALYAAQLTADERAAYDPMLDPDVAVAHYLGHGARAGRRISAVFHPQWYADRLAERGQSVPDGVVPFLHWLAVGWEQRIVPTPLFDEAFYRERHPLVAHPWPFVHYLNRGLYEAKWCPSPIGRHHPGADDAADADGPDRIARRAPLLLREMLHRAEAYDLARTSWLEEGCLAALASYARLDSAPMRALVAKAAAIEPLVHTPRPVHRKVSCPPHRHPRLYLTDLVEATRREVGVTHVDTVVLVPATSEPHPSEPDTSGRRLVAAIRAAEPEGELLVVGTDAEPGPGGRDSHAAPRTLELAARTQGLPPDQQVDLLLDVVRGLTPRRVVVADSRLGWDLVTTYGRQLSRQSSLGAFLPTWDHDEAGRRVGFAITEFRDCFAQLDWVVVVDDALRKELVDRYLLPAASQRRLLLVEEPGETDSWDAAVAAALPLSRRRA